MADANTMTKCVMNLSVYVRSEAYRSHVHLTLQDRRVKELRLRGISTLAAANAYAPAFMAPYNARFAKPPRSTFDAHRPLRDDEISTRF